jgi:hypothetical protein
MNRKATFAKRQRETELKDRAKAKGDRRAQKRGEVREVKGPQIAWEEQVQAVSTDEEAPVTDLPSLRTGTQDVQHAASTPTDDFSGPPGPYTPRR